MRYYYLYPTYDKPSGGNKQLRLQATLLRELGVETYLLRDEAFFKRGGGFDDNTYYGVKVDTAGFPFEAAESHLSPDDVLILPEVVLNRVLPLCQSWRVRLAVNNQNGFYGLRYGPPKAACRRLEFAIANAPYVHALCRHFYGMSPQRIFHVPHWIVRPPFEVASNQIPTKLAVSFMPRKLPEIVQQVKERVQKQLPDVPWVKIDGVPEQEVAGILKTNKVFFAAQDLEGCPLTALEAMTCSTLVAGFPGTARFPHPYATSENGCWARDRDVAHAAEMVVRAIGIARHGGEPYLQMLKAGYDTANHFSSDAVNIALRDLVTTTSNRKYSDRNSPVPQLGTRGWLQSGRLMYDYDRLGMAGRCISVLMKTAKKIMHR